MSIQIEEPKLIDVCRNFGLTIESSPPTAGVTPAEGKDGWPWPHIAYTVTVWRTQQTKRQIWSGPFKLGIGHVDMKKRLSQSDKYRLGDDAGPLEHMLDNPSIKSPPERLASIACKLAVMQKVTPKLDDVMASLMFDASPHLNHETFADWCANFGYDTDSIKARQTYDTCVDIGMAVARSFTATELKQLQEAASNH